MPVHKAAYRLTIAPAWSACWPADVSMALCRMVAYNIGQLAYMNATRFNLKRVFFGGFFIRGHPYTMETISFAIRFWSKVGLHKGALAKPDARPLQ
jgi:pantothenate kinase